MRLNHDEIIEYIESLEKDARAIRENMLQLAWSMRGGVTYEELAYSSPMEREIMMKIAIGNIEITKKIQMPHF